MPQPLDLAGSRFDVVIIGGGIYGIMTTLEAVRRELRPLLLERETFAGATSRNSLKIVHGGFRYLQSVDMRRFFESVRERRWFLRHFPDYVRPLPCLMPFYGSGLRRRSILATAVTINDVLTFDRNWGVLAECRLPGGHIVTADTACEIFPAVDREGLKGGAIWYDAMMTSGEDLAGAVLHWAKEFGAVAVAGVGAVKLIEDGGDVAGVVARPTGSERDIVIRSRRVINTAGPWVDEVADFCHAGAARMRSLSLAWNVSFRRAPLSDHGLALTARRAGAQTYFAVPRDNELLIGTSYAPWTGSAKHLALSDQILRCFVDEINETVPGLDLAANEMSASYLGLLPAVKEGSATLARRPIIVDHGAAGVAKGFYSVSGIKFTTARAVADSVLSRAFPARRPVPYSSFHR